MQGSTGAASNEVLEFVGIPTLSAIHGGAGRARRDRRHRHAGHAHGRDQGRDRRREGDCARRARRLGRHRRDHRRRLHRLPAVRTSASASSASRPRTPSTRSATTSTSSPGTSTAISSPCAGSWPRSSTPTATQSVHELSRDDLVALTPEAAEITRLPYAPEYASNTLAKVAAGRERARVHEPAGAGRLRPRSGHLAGRAAGIREADDAGDTNFVPAPCQVACPIGTDAPSYLAYIWEGKIEEAFEAITATNPVLVRLRPRLRRALRAGLPPRRSPTGRSPSATSSAT